MVIHLLKDPILDLKPNKMAIKPFITFYGAPYKYGNGNQLIFMLELDFRNV